MVCSIFIYKHVVCFSRSYLEIHKQKRESEIVVMLLEGMCVIHDIKSPIRTDTIAVLDREN